MIFTGILSHGYTLISWVLGLFPSSTGFPFEVHEAMASLGGYVGIWSPILPMKILAFWIGIVLAVEISIFGFRTVKWLISHIPQIGGRG